jgi:lipoprotein-anchoring transpeptidase ErfK/SrfK
MTASAAIAAALSSLVLADLPTPAQAQGFGWYGGGPSYYSQRRALQQRRRSAAARRERDEDGEGKRGKHAAVVEKAPNHPLFAVLSLSDQHISVYNSSGLVTRSKVSTGMPGHRTPTGIFTIIGRERWHTSNIYSGAPMPYMQRITWSGVALHLGVVPGYPASHGCIRLPSGSAQRLWGLTRIGERVVISPREVGPVEITSPLLPVPSLQPSPALAENVVQKPTEVATTATATLPLGEPKLLNPLAYAQALKVRAVADAATANKALKELSDRTATRPEAVRRALAEKRAAEANHAQAQAKLAAKERALAAAKRPATQHAAESAKAAAEAHLAEATRRLEAATSSEALKSPEGQEALAAEGAYREAKAALAKAESQQKEAERRTSPLSILVSKKDGKVYLRQGLAPVLNAPIVIRNPEVPLGTHVYIATAQEDGRSLGWTAISLPASHAGAEESPRHRREAHEKTLRAEPVAGSDAAHALERIELPTEVSTRIAELLWTGSSLIITDHPLSDETSDIGTDLVVTTHQ